MCFFLYSLNQGNCCNHFFSSVNFFSELFAWDLKIRFSGFLGSVFNLESFEICSMSFSEEIRQAEVIFMFIFLGSSRISSIISADARALTLSSSTSIVTSGGWTPNLSMSSDSRLSTSSIVSQDSNLL